MNVFCKNYACEAQKPHSAKTKRFVSAKTSVKVKPSKGLYEDGSNPPKQI